MTPMTIGGVYVLPRQDVPKWLTQIGVPVGWRIGRYTGSDPNQPWRIAVCGPQPNGGWDACETVTAFGLTGAPTPQEMRHQSERTLRKVNAGNITTVEVEMPTAPGVYALRSSGYFRVREQWIWGQYTYYVKCSSSPADGRMLQHCLHVELSRWGSLDADVAQLSDALHNAVLMHWFR